MPSNPLQACPIDKPYDLRQLKALDLGIGTRRVLFGPRIKACIEVQDEHIEIDLAGHTGSVLGAMRLSESAGDATRFLTVGDDRRMFIWNIQGEIQHELAGHTSRIGAVWELTGGRIVTWGEDKWLRVWSTRESEPIATIKTKVRSPDRVLVAASGDFFVLREWWATRLVSHSGSELATLGRFAEPMKTVSQLDSGGWFTETAQGMKLWSSQGELQRAFPHTFSLDDGYLELPDGQLVVIDNAYGLTSFDRQGVLTGKRGADEDLSRDLRRFVRCRKSVHEAIAARQTLAQFEHHKSPVGEPVVPKDATTSAPEDAALQQFFDRPDPKRIRTWRRDEIQAALHAREHLEDALHHHRVRRSLFWNAGLLAVGLFGVALSAVLSATESSEFRWALVALVACFWLVVGLHFKGRSILAAENVLATLLPQTDALIALIKAHRRRILEKFCSAEARRTYAGDETQRLIDQKIAGELSALAMQECGLQPGDLTTAGRRPLVLHDWALLQLGRDVEEEGAPPAPNLGSFWWTAQGNFVFGVQSVLFVLLTRERVHVVGLEYDFIARRIEHKTAHTFTYREVTSITARDVVRSAARAGVPASVDATEITLQLKNGLRISFSALHPQGAHALRRAVKDRLGTALTERQRNLESEIMSWKRDSQCTDDERKDAISSLQEQLAAVEEAELTAAVQPNLLRQRLDETLAHLRSMILDYKPPATSNILSRRSSGPRPDAAGARVISLDGRRSASS